MSISGLQKIDSTDVAQKLLKRDKEMKESKIQTSYDKNRQCLGEIYPLSTPFTVILDTSEACNFRCSYCFRATDLQEAWGNYAIKKNLMKWDVFERAVEQIKEFPESVKQISLSNHGEPLCNRRLPEMVRYIKDQGITARISIHTNAALLDKEYALELAESGIDKVVISLQGLTSEKYKEICAVELHFDTFYKNLKYLYDNKKENTVINIKIMDVAVGNQEEEFYEKFSKIADHVFVEKMVPIWKNTGNGECKPDKVMNKYGEAFPYQECCPLLFNTLVVTPDGDVYPCTQVLSEECLGNVSECSLVELWNGKERTELLRRQLLLEAPESCNGCYIRQNSIFTREDMIDAYRLDILKRLKK